MKIPSKLVAAVAAVSAALPLIANAHYIWLERNVQRAGPAAQLYFGEVAEVREHSPGRMDSIKAPRAWALSASGATELAVRRTQDFFAITGPLADQLVATDVGYEVKDWTSAGIGIVKPMYYARHSAWPLKQPVASANEIKLDIQPVAGSRSRFLVLFGGKPLPKTKAVIYAPNDWEKEYKTDDTGQLSMQLPWKGQYVIEVIHKELIAGEFEGKKFDALRHRAVLTVVQPVGLSSKGTGGGASSPGKVAGAPPAAK